MAQLIEAGTYQGKAREGVLGETSGGKEQVAVRFELIDIGQQLTWYGYFTDKTLESTFRALRTAGWRGQELSDLSDLAREDVPVVNLVVEHEADQQGVVRAKIRWVNSASGIGVKSVLPPDKAKAFSARMKGALVAFDRAAGQPATQKPPAQRPAPRNAPDEATQHRLLEEQAAQQGGDVPF